MFTKALLTSKIGEGLASPDTPALNWSKVISEEVARLCEKRFGNTLQAVVLTGSLAREEGSFLEQGGEWKALGDAEFVLVFRRPARLPDAETRRTLRREIASRLEDRRLSCSVGLSAVYPAYLSSLTPHIYAYELRTCGRTVWGDPHVLSLIPAFSPEDIPLEDAWRLLCNRIVEQLELAEDISQQASPASLPTCYRTVKLYLDMATSLLLFLRAFVPGYGARSEKLRKLAGFDTRSDLYPFPLAPFAERVAACTDWKLSPHAESHLASKDFWKAAVADARLLWRWELAQMTRCDIAQKDLELMRGWMRQQSVIARLRGWAHVVRKLGWNRSRREAFRWARLACHASPRYWTYAAACSLFFAIPSVANGDDETRLDTDWERLRDWLPVPRAQRSEREDSWKKLAAHILWNYREFLVETRS